MFIKFYKEGVCFRGMKLLVIGDFHGKFPKKFETLIKKERIDLVVSLGDYPPFHYRKLWFKHCYGKDVELWEFIGKKKYKELVIKDLRMAEDALKDLNKLPVPVYTVLGNIDYPAPDDNLDIPKGIGKAMLTWDKKDFLAKRMKKYKNIKRFDYKSLKFRDYVFIGMRGHSAPGHVKSKAFRKYKQKLNKLFKKFKKENKKGKVIFVSHNIAHNTKLDKISLRVIKKVLKGYYGGKLKKKKLAKHYGSKMARRIINTYQPVLHFGGHIHEAWGKDKIGKTILINPGAAHEGRAAIVELKEGKVKSVRFVK